MPLPTTPKGKHESILTSQKFSVLVSRDLPTRFETEYQNLIPTTLLFAPEMKPISIVLLTITGTLLIEAILLQSWVARTMFLNIIDPHPNDSKVVALTETVKLTYHETEVGKIEAGQILYPPCRHDL